MESSHSMSNSLLSYGVWRLCIERKENPPVTYHQVKCLSQYWYVKGCDVQLNYNCKVFGVLSNLLQKSEVNPKSWDGYTQVLWALAISMLWTFLIQPSYSLIRILLSDTARRTRTIPLTPKTYILVTRLYVFCTEPSCRRGPEIITSGKKMQVFKPESSGNLNAADSNDIN